MSKDTEDYWITSLKNTNVEFVGLVKGNRGIVSKKLFISRETGSKEMKTYYFLKEGPKLNGSFIAELAARKMIEKFKNKKA